MYVIAAHIGITVFVLRCPYQSHSQVSVGIFLSGNVRKKCMSMTWMFLIKYNPIEHIRMFLSRDILREYINVARMFLIGMFP